MAKKPNTKSKSKTKNNTGKGVFTSVWDGGEEIESSCKFDRTTGETFNLKRMGDDDVEDFEDLGQVDSEFVTDNETGEKYFVCPDCHEYIMLCDNGDLARVGNFKHAVCKGCGHEERG